MPGLDTLAEESLETLTLIFGHIGSIHSSRVLFLLGKDMVMATKLETQGSTG